MTPVEGILGGRNTILSSLSWSRPSPPDRSIDSELVWHPGYIDIYQMNLAGIRSVWSKGHIDADGRVELCNLLSPVRAPSVLYGFPTLAVLLSGGDLNVQEVAWQVLHILSVQFFVLQQ